jgi:hypothetical protein
MRHPETASREWCSRFSVEGLAYEFSAINGGPVAFRIIGGASPIKAFSGSSWEAWDDDIVPFHSEGYFRNALPVVRQVVSLLADWVRIEKPFLFHFEATDPRKHRIYRHLVGRHGPSLASRYTHYMNGSRFYFVRRQEVQQ